MPDSLTACLRVPLPDGRILRFEVPLEDLKTSAILTLGMAERMADNFRRQNKTPYSPIAVAETPAIPLPNRRRKGGGPPLSDPIGAFGGPSRKAEERGVETGIAVRGDGHDLDGIDPSNAGGAPSNVGGITEPATDLTLDEARLFWAGEVEALDTAMAPLRDEEARIKALLVATHETVVNGSPVRLQPYRIDTRPERAELFAALDALQPGLGPLRKRRQAARAEVRSLDLRLKAEAALAAREAKRSATASVPTRRQTAKGRP